MWAFGPRVAVLIDSPHIQAPVCITIDRTRLILTPLWSVDKGGMLALRGEFALIATMTGGYSSLSRLLRWDR